MATKWGSARDFIIDAGIVAVVRAGASGELVDVVKAVAAGGVKAIEVTMTTPNALKVISESVSQVGDDVLMGVGSVLDPETARAAILAGAEYVVTPTLSPETVRISKRYNKTVICGAFTPTEILRAWDCGADLVKVFPASLGGPGLIKAIKGPLPQIPLVPTGGVDLGNVVEFFEAGASALAVGGKLVKKDLIAAKDFDGLTEIARAFMAEVKKARG